MFDMIAIAGQLAARAGIAALVIASVAAVVLHRRNRSGPTLVLLTGIAALWVGSIVQLVAPPGAISYVSDVGATGTFSTTWYLSLIHI